MITFSIIIVLITIALSLAFGAKGACYWVAYYLLKVWLFILGLFPTFVCAFTGSVEMRDSRNPMFKDRMVHAWRKPWFILAGLSQIAPAALLGVPLWLCIFAGVTYAVGEAIGIWDNDEDGVLGATWYTDAHKSWPVWLTAFVWSAIRNVADNERLLRGASFYISQNVTHSKWGPFDIGRDGWRWCLQYKTHHIGWLIYDSSRPGDRSWPVWG